MQELAPGLWHWTALRESIGADVDSYYLERERVAIDPMLPPERPDWFAPEHALLTNRHHDRDAWRLGCDVWVVEQGAHELAGRGELRTFRFGEELPGGVVAHEVDAICPDECALHLPAHRALVVADGVVRWPGVEGLSFVPDGLLDEPERTKEGLRAAYRRLLELDWDTLLLAHGGPATKADLRAFLEG